MLLDWIEGFDEWAMTAEEYIDANTDQVIVRIHQTATGTQSGAVGSERLVSCAVYTTRSSARDV